MKLKISLSQMPMLPPISGANFIPDPLEGMIEEGEKYSIIFNLTKDCTTTEKFIRIMNEISKTPFSDITDRGTGSMDCSYNFYPTIQVDTFIQMKKRMNWIIEYFTARDDVPSPEQWTVLDEDSLDPEVIKLNALHLYFEDVSNDITTDTLRYVDYDVDGPLYQYLEEINQLVHSMENWEDSGFYRASFGTIRLTDHEGNLRSEPLTDQDYNNFTKELEWGDLTLDYFRVGKDLQTCYATNDVELIKTKGLEQQSTVHPAFEFRFEDCNDFRDHIPNWIKENNLDQYYDFSLPKFNSGRIVLGKIDLTGTNKENLLDEMMKSTGIFNIEMIDE